jgi:hypothetical protein
VDTTAASSIGLFKPCAFATSIIFMIFAAPSMTWIPFRHEGFGQMGYSPEYPSNFLVCEFTNHILKNNMVLAQLDILLTAHEPGSSEHVPQ